MGNTHQIGPLLQSLYRIITYPRDRKVVSDSILLVLVMHMLIPNRKQRNYTRENFYLSSSYFVQNEFSLLQSFFENAVNWTLLVCLLWMRAQHSWRPQRNENYHNRLRRCNKKSKLVLVWSVIPCNEAYTSETSFHHYYSLSPRPTMSISDYIGQTIIPNQSFKWATQMQMDIECT